MSQQHQSQQSLALDDNDSSPSSSSSSSSSISSDGTIVISSDSSSSSSSSQSSTSTLTDEDTAPASTSVEAITLRFIDAYRQLKIAEFSSSPTLADMCEFASVCCYDDLLAMFEREVAWPPVLESPRQEERDAALVCVQHWCSWLECATNAFAMRGFFSWQPAEASSQGLTSSAFDRLWQATSRAACRELLHVTTQSSTSPLFSFSSFSSSSSQQVPSTPYSSQSSISNEDEAAAASAAAATVAAFRASESSGSLFSLSTLNSVRWTSSSTPATSQPPPSVSWSSQQPWSSQQQSVTWSSTGLLPTLSWSLEDVSDPASTTATQEANRTFYASLPGCDEEPSHEDDNDDSIIVVSSKYSTAQPQQ